MHRTLKPKRRGAFTLLELMIAVVVVAIIAAIAYPSYVESIRKSRRADAKSILSLVGERLERCFAECNSYTAASCGAPCPTLPVTSTEGYYRVLAGPVAATSWSLTATPVAGKSQETDAACTSFTLTSTGAKSATGASAATCWD